MTRYKHILSLFDEPWAILPEKMVAIAGALEARMAGQHLTDLEIAAVMGQAEPPAHVAGQSIAVLPLFGTISQHAGLMQKASGGTSTEQFGSDLRKLLADPAIGTIIIETNSPGGSVHGIMELSNLIYSSRSQKRIIAHVNSMAASAGFWIATAASEVVITPGGTIGSHGVVTMHTDVSKAEEAQGMKTTLIATPAKKIQGHPFEPLSEDARAEIEAKNQAWYDRFTEALARNRGVRKPSAIKNFGGGGMMLAEEAVQAGAADQIATLDEVIQDVLSNAKTKSRRRARQAALDIAAADV